MTIQALVSGLSAQWQKERSETQFTLGELIDYLKEIPQETRILGLGDLESYRGYYSDLAFEPTTEDRTANDLLNECQSAMGEVFTGYKGGEFVMGRNTPLWVSSYGTCGPRLMGFSEVNGMLYPVKQEED